MDVANKELHIIIVWERGQESKNRIVADIKETFSILEIKHVLWDEDNFSRNLTRFYGQSLPDGSAKELECGKGRFTLIIIADDNPVYSERNTHKGVMLVNTNMFDAKARYRQWTGGGHKIHATNSPQETARDLFLLLGICYDDYLENAPSLASRTNISEENINRNLVGCNEWESLAGLFEMLNKTIDYVVLRNFDGMPENYYSQTHGDIDLLTNSSPIEVAFLMNATPVFPQKHRVHFKVNVKSETLRFDIRYVGDDYYCKSWQHAILENKIPHKGFHIPSEEDFKYSLLYHALIHKNTIADDYQEKLSNLGFDSGSLFDELKVFLEANNYEITEPRDRSVYFNTSLSGKSTSLTRRWIKLKNFVRDHLAALMSPALRTRLKRVVARLR
jgi:hypothetical protein